MNKFVGVLLILALVTIMVIGGCAPKPAATKTLKVGISADFSSVASSWGIGMARGVELEVERINAKGGVKIGQDTYLLQAIRADNMFTSEGGKTAGEKLVYSDKVNVICGGMSSHDTLGVQMVTTPAKVLSCTSAWERKVVKEEGQPTVPYVFKCVATPRETTRGIFNYIEKIYPEVERFAVVAPNQMSSLYSVENEELYAEYLGWEIVFKEHFELGTKDLYPILAKALATNPDVIETADVTIPDMGMLVKQAREMGYEGFIVNDTCIIGTDLFDIAGAEAMNGVVGHDVCTFGPYATPEYMEYEKAYRQKYGAWFSLVLNWPMFLHCYLQAVQDVGNVDDVDAIVQALETGSFDVFGYDVSFGGTEYYGRPRMLGQPLMVIEVKGGKVEPQDFISIDEQLSAWPTD